MPPGFTCLARMRLRQIANRLQRIGEESLLKITVVTLMGAALWGGLFFGFLDVFRFLRQFPDFQAAIIDYVLALFFLSLLGMLTFSNALLAFWALFRSEETHFLFTKPLRPESVYHYKFLEVVTFSSWASVVLVLPVMIAYGLQNGAPWYFYPGILLYLVPFVFIPAALGALGGMLLSALFPRHRLKVFGLVVAVLAVWGGTAAIRAAMLGRGIQVTGAVRTDFLDAIAIGTRPMVPSYWATKGLLALACANLGAGAFYWFALTATAAAGVAAGDLAAGACYARAWAGVAAGGNIRRRRERTGLIDRLARLAGRVDRITAALVGKDVKSFLRDPAQWGQAAIFFGVLGLYFANLRSLRYHRSEEFWRGLVYFLNLGVTSLILAIFTTRFIFPLLSLEGRRFWVLGLAPISRARLVWAKFAYAFVGALVITEPLILLSNTMLQMPRLYMGLQLYATAFVCLGLTGLAVGLGAIFPNFKEDNPSRVVSGFGGTLTLIFSVGLVALVVASQAVPFALHLRDRTVPVARYLALGAGVFTLTALVAGLLPVFLGVRALERTDF